MKVIKRDGSRVSFDINKIIHALEEANKEVELEHQIDEDTIKEIAEEATNFCKSQKKSQTIEAIQDQVELGLMKRNAYELAKKYIEYRYEHKQIRDAYSTLLDGIEQKLMAKNVQNQNANLDEKSFGGRVGEMSSFVNKQFALNYCMSEMARNNHLNNEIYIHDLDSYSVGSHNCLSVPIDDLLAKGFKTRQVDIRPAGSLSTALQLVAVIFQLQSLMQFGGVSATHLDWSMVPYARMSFAKHFKDGLKYIENADATDTFFCFDPKTRPIDANDYKKYDKVYTYALDMLTRECHQAVEALYHNLKH